MTPAAGPIAAGSRRPAPSTYANGAGTSAIGTKRTWCDVRPESVMRCKADIPLSVALTLYVSLNDVPQTLSCA
jgi:hypothetical protein